MRLRVVRDSLDCTVTALPAVSWETPRKVRTFAVIQLLSEAERLPGLMLSLT